MAYIEEHEKSLTALLGFFKTTFRLTEEESDQLEQLLDDYVKDRADLSASRALDREFNRGDYRG